jgi:hypothetical protein
MPSETDPFQHHFFSSFIQEKSTVNAKFSVFSNNCIAFNNCIFIFAFILIYATALEYKKKKAKHQIQNMCFHILYLNITMQN